MKCGEVQFSCFAKKPIGSRVLARLRAKKIPCPKSPGWGLPTMPNAVRRRRMSGVSIPGRCDDSGRVAGSLGQDRRPGPSFGLWGHPRVPFLSTSLSPSSPIGGRTLGRWDVERGIPLVVQGLGDVSWTFTHRDVDRELVVQKVTSFCPIKIRDKKGRSLGVISWPFRRQQCFSR